MKNVPGSGGHTHLALYASSLPMTVKFPHPDRAENPTNRASNPRLLPRTVIVGRDLVVSPCPAARRDLGSAGYQTRDYIDAYVFSYLAFTFSSYIDCAG